VYANVTGRYASVLDSGWVIGYLMMALAALWPSGVTDRSCEINTIALWQLALPWFAVLAGGISAVVTAILFHPMDVFATALAGAVIALLMASQVMAHRESLLLLIKSRLSAATLNEVIVHAPLGVVRIAPDLTVIDVNPSFCSMLGTSSGEAVGGPIDRFFPARKRDLCRH